jgi:glycosyltransferase involved in cell wall biosynthesis
MVSGDDRPRGARGQPIAPEGDGGAATAGRSRGAAPRPRARVLLLATSLDTGGAERALSRLAAGLPSRGFDVEAASLLPPGALGRALAAGGIRVHDLGGARKTALPRAALALARLLARGRFDALASLLFHANQVARIAARLLGPGRPAHLASIRIVERARPWRQALERLLLPLSERVVFVSEDARRIVCGGRPPRRALVIRNGVPLPATPAPLAPGAPWVALGRVEPQKGVDVLLEAWRLLASAGAPPPPRLLVAGRLGPGGEALRARAAALALPIEFLGEVEDPAPLLAGAGGMVLASRYEGTPNALLEGMAAGLPCVATRAGGVPEVLAEGREGLLVPVEDPAALAAAVRALVLDPARAAALGRAARERVAREHGEARMVDAWARAIEEAIAERA